MWTCSDDETMEVRRIRPADCSQVGATPTEAFYLVQNQRLLSLVKVEAGDDVA